MDIHLLGSIASIISVVISLGFMFWSVTKKRNVSFFNLYMLVIVLIQAISVVWWLWNGKITIAVGVGMLFMFTILLWIIMHLNKEQLDIAKLQGNIIKEINQDMRQFSSNFADAIEIIRELIRIESTRMDMESTRMDINTKRLEDKLKKLQKKIDKIDKKKSN